MEAPSRQQIVICCDGTNDTLTGGLRDSNVLRLHKHLAAQAPRAGFQRLLYYDPGVGSPGTLPPAGPVEALARGWRRVSGLASGSGVFENIAAAYVFLMHHWRDNGDLIYLFGFSRGAFTVRALAGMVNLFGIVRPEYEELVPTLVHIYFSPPAGSHGGPVQQSTRTAYQHWTRPRPLERGSAEHLDEDLGERRNRVVEQVRREFAGTARRDAWVHWIGVWDTVESVGLPGPLSRVNPTPPTLLGKRYRNVRHALALDEHRWPFLPRLYEEPGDVDEPLPPLPEYGPEPRQTLKQRWYPGVHADIGGGYRNREAAVSEAALCWMVDEVRADLGIAAIAPADREAHLWRHDETWYTPWWAIAGLTLRDMHPKFRRPGAEQAREFEAIPADNLPGATIRSIWEKPRPWPPVLAALVLGLLFLVASGLCLMDSRGTADGAAATMLRAVQAARQFADQQLAALWGQGLAVPGHRPWELVVQPGWAMFWDLCFVACWGYLLARVSSRAFAWLAGSRSVDSTRPWWLGLGFAPLVAVCGDVAEDLCLWLALALHAAGTDTLALLGLRLGGAASLAKILGLAACLVLVAVRCRIVFHAPPPLDGGEQPVR
jgi:uncharacterized protein (DUF2235 family)